VEVSFKIAGRVDKRLIDEGEKVEAGQLVAVLDTSELLRDLAFRQAQWEAAQATLLLMIRGYLPEEIAQAKAKEVEAKADLDRQKADYKRQHSLYRGEVISAREFDSSSNAYEVAKARYQSARENLILLEKGTRVEKIQEAEANLEAAKQSVALAEVRLGYANLYSPLKGYALTKNVETGEYVSAGTPIITVGNLHDVWLRAYVDESQMGLVYLGQKVHIKTDSYPNKVYEGHVTFISQEAEFTPKNVQTEKERVKLVYRIKAEVPNETLELKPGMPADGYIQLNKG
jgi:HlyD family secretion protein